MNKSQHKNSIEEIHQARNLNGYTKQERFLDIFIATNVSVSPLRAMLDGEMTDSPPPPFNILQLV